MWFIQTVKSFLTDQTTTLVVNGKETAPRQLPARVPQGSPLSPILFLFYNAPLLEAVNQPDLPMILLGFADDINLLTYSELTIVNSVNLETAHDQCLEWACTHGMRFALDKYTLTHFTRHRGINIQTLVKLQRVEIQPKPVVRILRLQLDTKL